MNKIESNLREDDFLKRKLKRGDIISDGAKTFRTINYNFLTGNAVFDSYNDNLIYKFFGPMSPSDRRNLEARIRILAKVDLDVIVKPIDMIVDAEKHLFFHQLTGITTEKVKDAISLDDLSRAYGRDVEYFKALVNTSLGLDRIHRAPQKIILSDASFNNVLMKKSRDNLYTAPKFIDIDSANVKGHRTPWRPRETAKYYEMIGKKYVPSENNDRLNYLLLFLYKIFSIYAGTIFDIKDADFDKKAEIIRSLKSIRNIFIDLKNGKIPYIPYFYEFLVPGEGKYESYRHLNSSFSNIDEDEPFNRKRIR